MTSRAKGIFVILLAVLLIGTLAVFALLANSLSFVPPDERVSAFVLLSVLWIIMVGADTVITLVMFQGYGAR